VLLSVPHVVPPHATVTAPSRPVPEHWHGAQPLLCKDQPDALHEYVLLSVPHVVSPQLTFTGPSRPVPEQEHGQPALWKDQPDALHE
jgi:hypothetical protein